MVDFRGDEGEVDGLMRLTLRIPGPALQGIEISAEDVNKTTGIIKQLEEIITDTIIRKWMKKPGIKFGIIRDPSQTVFLITFDNSSLTPIAMGTMREILTWVDKLKIRLAPPEEVARILELTGEE